MLRNDNQKNDVCNEFHYSTFSKITKHDGDRIEFKVLPEFGDGTQVLYKVIDGMFITYCDYSYDRIDCQKNDMSFNDAFIMYQILDGKMMLSLKDHKAAFVREGDIVNYAGSGAFVDAVGYNSRMVAIGVYCYYHELVTALQKQGYDVEVLQKYYIDMVNNDEVLIYSDDIKFKTLAKELSELLFADNRFLLKPKALELLYCGITDYKKHKKNTHMKYDRKYVDIVFEVKKYMDENWDTIETIAGLAAQFGINLTYFKDIFKECYCATPYQHLIRKRLEKAKELLSGSDMKIVDIGLELRFASSSKFSEAFKKEFGYLPSHFRKAGK